MTRAPIKPLPSQGELRRLFAYDPVGGALTWLANPKHQGVASGKCGTVTKRGYLTIGIKTDKRAYFLAHRIIWKMVTGEEPAFQIDHIDGDRLNNKWANLRQADNGQNRWNSKIAKNNKSGVKGVCWDAGHQAWAAVINRKRLGRFKSFDEACAVRRDAAIRLHGEFMREL